MKKIEIQFSGAVREITKAKQITWEFEDQADYRVIVERLAREFPELVGIIISPENTSLLSASLFNRNGEELILPDQMDAAPEDGDRLMIVNFIVGG